MLSAIRKLTFLSSVFSFFILQVNAQTLSVVDSMPPSSSLQYPAPHLTEQQGCESTYSEILITGEVWLPVSIGGWEKTEKSNSNGWERYIEWESFTFYLPAIRWKNGLEYGDTVLVDVSRRRDTLGSNDFPDQSDTASYGGPSVDIPISQKSAPGKPSFTGPPSMVGNRSAMLQDIGWVGVTNYAHWDSDQEVIRNVVLECTASDVEEPQSGNEQPSFENELDNLLQDSIAQFDNKWNYTVRAELQTIEQRLREEMARIPDQSERSNFLNLALDVIAVGLNKKDSDALQCARSVYENSPSQACFDYMQAVNSERNQPEISGDCSSVNAAINSCQNAGGDGICGKLRAVDSCLDRARRAASSCAGATEQISAVQNQIKQQKSKVCI